jgi:signal peptidase II
MKLSRFNLSVLIILIIITADQILKFWIKTHMMLGEEYHVLGNWFIIHFVENNGMAFGFELAGNYGKMVLSIFRVIAVFAIGWFLIKLSKREVPRGFMISLAFIFAGAIGNIIDSVFYGILFGHSYGQVAEFMPAGGGYAGLLHGKVVDMFYFPIINSHYPDWFPIWGGEEFVFFRPVFNIADSSITVGIFSILIFYKNFFNELSFKTVVKEETAEEQIITISDADADE